MDRNAQVKGQASFLYPMLDITSNIQLKVEMEMN